MSKAKQKGTFWETAIVTFLIPFFPHAERRALNGQRDRCDITGIPGTNIHAAPCIEAKNATPWRLPEWWREVQTEVANAGAHHGVLWLKRRGKTSAREGWVIMDGDTYVKLLKEAGW